MNEIADGTYNVIVVSADETDDDGSRVDIAFVEGAYKGATLTLRSTMSIDRAIVLLGLPATLEVNEGKPRLVNIG
jgi:hypothetical protein